MKEHLCVGGDVGVVICEYGAVWDDVKKLVNETQGKIWVRFSIHAPRTQQ